MTTSRGRQQALGGHVLARDIGESQTSAIRIRWQAKERKAQAAFMAEAKALSKQRAKAAPLQKIS